MFESAQPSASDVALLRFLVAWCDEPGAAVDEAAAAALAALIERLDRAALANWEDTSLAARALTRAIAAVGPLLIQRQGYGDDHPVARTLAAAERYNERPSEQAHEAYVAAATDSYPYGAGDGCYRLPTAHACEPGSGCTSGAGSLASTALPAAAVVAAVRHELREWLRPAPTQPQSTRDGR